MFTFWKAIPGNGACFDPVCVMFILFLFQLMFSYLADFESLTCFVVAMLKAQISLQLGKVFSSDNGVSVSIMYSTHTDYTAKRKFLLLKCMSAL